MTSARCHLLTLVLAIASLSTLPAQDFFDNLTSNLDIQGLETTFDPQTGIATAIGNVEIKYGDTEILAGRADYNANTGDIMARDNVTVWKAGITYKSESIIYNVNSGELTGNVIRSSLEKDAGSLLYTTEQFKTETRFIEKIEGEGTFLTTHDLAEPNFRVKAKRMTIYPFNRVVMKNVTLYAGDTPVFWLPYVSQPLDDELGYTFTPGWVSNWGMFLLNQYGMMHGDHTLAKYKLDLRSERGVAAGVDFISMRHRWNQLNFGTLKLYYANDTDTELTRAGGTRASVDTDRYRVNFAHRVYLPGPEASTWYIDFDLNKISDIHFYEDFFFQDVRANREPDNQISLVHVDDRYVATLWTRFQLNDFYRAATRLPELAFDFTRQPIFDSGVFYQGSTTAGVYAEQFGQFEIDSINAQIAANDAQRRFHQQNVSIDPSSRLVADEFTQANQVLRQALQEPGFNRVHSYHEFLYPKKFFGWLNVVPRVGGGFTHYDGIQGLGTTLDSETKGLFNFGMDVSFKLSKNWEDVQNSALGLDGLRHVFQPYLNYSYLDAEVPEGLPVIDRLAPSTRPRSLDVPLYTAIDDLRSWNIARIGMRNVLQTRRDYQSNDLEMRASPTMMETTQTYAWAGLNTYVDVFFDDPEFNRDMSNLYNEFFWRPVPWLNFWGDTQLPIGNNDANFLEINYGITWMPTSTVTFTIGHQHMTDNPLFQDSSLIFSRVFARINENWGFSMNHIYEMDDRTLEFQSYSIHRDLSSWSASFGAMVRDNRNGLSDFGLLLSLTLKEFPQVSIPLDVDPNPTGRGGRF